jgi:hypothetical protein
MIASPLGLLALAALSIGPAGQERWRPPELRVASRAPAAFPELKERALAYLGRPYVMGGVGDPGFDCSGFTCRVFAESGYAIPRVSRDQALVGRPVQKEALLPGDLVFFAAEPGESRITHVGLYLGGGEMVHAASGSGRVLVSSLRAAYYEERLVEARRILGAGALTSSTAATSSAAPSEAVLPLHELVEHSGEDALPPMLRLAPKLPAPEVGPELGSFESSSIAVRAAGLTEEGVLGLVVAPELLLRFPSLALLVELAMPIRFAPGSPATVGPIHQAADVLRFVRSLELGLHGADLELRLSRFGDVILADQLLVDHLAPSLRSSGVAGLSIARSPLSFVGGWRDGGYSLHLVIDDLVDPALVGAGGELSLSELGLDALGIEGAFATDQRAVAADGGRRAIDSAEAGLRFRALASRASTLELSASAAGERALGRAGGAGSLGLVAEQRFGRALGSAIGGRLEASLLGGGFLAGLFGPTYLASTGAHLVALDEARIRPAVFGELTARWNKLVLGAGWGDGFGRDRSHLDQRLVGSIELRGIGIGTLLFDLHAAYAARGPIGRPGGPSDAADTTRGTEALALGLRLRLNSWSFLELDVQRGARYEGGGGLTIGYAP